MVATKASLSKVAAEGNMHAKMAFFISSCLLFLGNSLRVLLRFINLNALRYQIYVDKHTKKYEEEHKSQNRFLLGNDTSGFKNVQKKTEKSELRNQLFGEEKITSFCSQGSSDEERQVRLISELSGLDSVTESSASDVCSIQMLVVDPEIRQTPNYDTEEEEEEEKEDSFEEQMNKEAVSNETSSTVLHRSACESFVAGKQAGINCIGREECELGKGTSQESKTWVREEDELDEIWEHQDLIEQLRMELKRVRAIGLPTIMEEPESPRNVNQTTPPDKHEKLVPEEDPMDELHKLHECYREKMRKLDILNYQKLYASGFLQLKDPLKTRRPRRHMLSTMVSRLSHSHFSSCKNKANMDPSENFIKEMRCDLETVYVGQTCLSWEFLRWQYELLCHLQESNSSSGNQYNQAAAEFGIFNVAVKKFLDTESFQGPRIPNYVEQRCVLRNLLQVPAIHEDCFGDDNVEAIGIQKLKDVVEEGMTTFWEFVKAEKNEAPGFSKRVFENRANLRDPSASAFMADVRASLQKKERKLKELMKAGGWMAKRWKRSQEEGSKQELFFSQVDLRLVSRVLRMTRITSEQLIWCHKKLNKITFSDPRVHRKPSFLLFPC